MFYDFAQSQIISEAVSLGIDFKMLLETTNLIKERCQLSEGFMNINKQLVLK